MCPEPIHPASGGGVKVPAEPRSQYRQFSAADLQSCFYPGRSRDYAEEPLFTETKVQEAEGR